MSLPVSSTNKSFALPNSDHIDTAQEGPICKTATLTTCMQLLYPDNYYPLRKNRRTGVELSVRKIAKAQGSSQGEITTPEQLNRIARELGLKAESKQFNDFNEMKHHIHFAITKGQPVIVFAQVDGETLYPSDEVKSTSQWHEHAAVVIGYYDYADILLVHDGYEKCIWKAIDLYNASCNVLKERYTETFVKFLMPRPEPAPTDDSEQAAGSSGSPEYSTPIATKESFNSSDLGTMDWETSFSDPHMHSLYQTLAKLVGCKHYSNNPCRHHEITDLVSLELDLPEILITLQESKYIAVRQSDQKSGANFHKLLMVIQKDS